MSNRYKVTVNLGVIPQYVSFTDLQSIIEDAKKRIELEGIKDVYLEMEYERGYYDDLIDVHGVIKGGRLETDEEMELRIMRNKQSKLEKEQREKQQYEQLKKKFEGK